MKQIYGLRLIMVFALFFCFVAQKVHGQCDGAPAGTTPLVSIRTNGGSIDENAAVGDLTSTICIEAAGDDLDLDVVIQDAAGTGKAVEEYTVDWGDGNTTTVNIPGGLPTVFPIRVSHPLGGYANETTNLGGGQAPYHIIVTARFAGETLVCTSEGDITITRRPSFAANISTGAQCAPATWRLRLIPDNVSINAEYDIDWGDGSGIETIVEDGTAIYNIDHAYASDPTICEYTVTVTARNVLDGACDGNTTINDVVRKYDVDDPQIGTYDPVSGDPQTEICESETPIQILRETVELPDPNNAALLCTPGNRLIRWEIFDGPTDTDPVLLRTAVGIVGNATTLTADNIGFGGTMADNTDYTVNFPARTAGHQFLIRSTETNQCGTVVEEQLITVVASPVAAISVAPDTVTCVGETLSFSRVNAGGITYTWHVDNGLNTGIPSDADFGTAGNENPFTFSTTTAGTYTVWLRAEGPGGGAEPLTCISYDSMQIEVLPDVVPDLVLSVQGGDLNNCDFATIDLDGSATANAPANSTYTFEVSRNSSFTNIETTLTGTADSYTGVVINHGNTNARRTWHVRLTVTTPQGCSNVTTTETFFTRELPQIDAIINSNAQMCSGDDTDLEIDLVASNSNFYVNVTAAVTSGAAGNVTGYSDVSDLQHGDVVSQTLVNTTTTQQTVRYIFIPENRRDASDPSEYCVNDADADTVFVVVDPEPLQPTISPADGDPSLTICEDGSTVVLTSDNPSGVGVTYEWYETGDLVTPVQATTSNTLTLSNDTESGEYVVRLVGATPTFCPGPFSDPVNVIINPLPAAPANPVDNTYCSDQGPNAVSVDDPGAGFAIDWYDAASGGSLLLSNSTSYTPGGTPVTTTYYAETRNTTTGCVSAARTGATLTRFDSPVSGVLARVGSAAICAGDSIEVTITINPAVGPGSGTYYLALSDALGNNGDVVIPAYTSGASTFITVLLNADYQLDSIADENGCYIDPASLSGNAAVTVSGPTAASIDFDATGTSPICLGTSTNLEVNVTGGTAPFTFYYNNDLGDGQFSQSGYSSGDPFAVTPSAAGLVTYALDSVVDNVGCRIPTVSLSTTAIVDVFEPEVTLTYPAASDVCEGDSITLIVTETNGSDTLDLVIEDQSGTIVYSNATYVSGSDIRVLPTAGVTTTYTIQSVQDAILPGCAVTDNTGAGPSVFSNVRPAINTQPLDVTVCHNTDTLLFVETVAGVDYEWQTDSGTGGVTWSLLSNGGGISGVDNDTLSLTAKDALNGYRFRVRVIDQVTLCDSLSAEATLTVNPLPVIDVQPGNVTICDLVSTRMVVQTSDPTYTYQWQTDNGSAGVTWTSLSDDAIYTGAANDTLLINGEVSLDDFRYRVIVSDPGVSCDSISAEATLTVNGLPGTTSPSDIIACHGDEVKVGVDPDDPSYIFIWQTDNGTAGVTWSVLSNGGFYSTVNADTLTIQADDALNGFQYRARVINPTTGCDSITNPMTLTVNPLPVITSQPGDEEICHNDNGAFSVTTSSASFTYQWQTDSGSAGVAWDDIADNSTYTGTTNATLNILGNDLIDGFRFRVVVTNPATLCDSISDEATLTVNPLPIINIHPADASVCDEDTATFTIAIADALDAIQWQTDNGSAGASWSNLSNAGLFSGVTTDQLEVIVDAANDGHQYRAVIFDDVTLCDSISNPATLTLLPLPVITNQPDDVEICHGDSDTFEVSYSGTGFDFTWQTDNGTGGVTWTDLSAGTLFSGVSTDVLSFTADNSLDGHRYRVIIGNPGTSCFEISDEVTLTVNPLPGISGQPADAETCVSGIGIIGSLATDPADLYRWQMDNGSGFNFISNGSVFLGASSDTLLILNPAGLDGAQFRVVVFDAATNCDSISDVATLTVTPEPTVPSPMSDVEVCGLLSGALNGTVPANGTGTWSVESQPAAATSVGFIDGVNDPNTTVAVDAFGVYEFRWTISNGSCTPVSEVVQVTYYDDPSTAVADAGGADTLSFCGTSIALDAEAPTIGTGRWYQAPGGTGTGTITFSPTTADRNATANIAAGEQGTYLLVWEVSNGPCAVSTDTIVASFDAEPPLSAIFGADTVCQGASNELYLVNKNVGSTWDWDVPAGITVNNGAGLSNGGLDSDNFALLEFPNTGTFTVTVFETSATCTVSDSVTIVVEGPVATNSIVGQDTVCAGTTGLVYSVPDNVGSIYNWTLNTTQHVIQPPNNVSSIEVDFGLTPGTFQLLVTETTTGGCISAQPDTIDIVVLDIPDITSSVTNPIICSGDSVGVTLDSPKGIASTSIELISVTQTGGISGFSLPGTIFNPGDTFPDVLTSSASSNRQIQYIFRAYTDGSGFSACEGDTLTMLVTVQPQPSLTVNNTRATLCSGSNTSVVLDSDVATADFIWSATGSDAALSGFSSDSTGGFEVITQQLTNASTDVHTVEYIIAATAAGCVSEPDTTTVTVNPRPAVSMEALDTLICEGESARLSIEFSSGLAPFSFTYSGGITNTPVNNASDSLGITVTPSSGTISYTILTMTDARGCQVSQPSSSITNDAVITVRPVPQAILTGGGVTCAGDSANLRVSVSGGTAPYEVVLDNGIGTISGYTSNTAIQVAPTSSTTYQMVSVTDALGCGVTAPSTRLLGIATVLINAAPTATIISDDVAFCAETASSTAGLTFSMTGTGPWTIDYSDGTDTSRLNFIASAVYTLPVSGVADDTVTYSLVQIQDGNSPACVGTVSGEMDVYRQSLPTGSLSGSTTICAGETAALTFSLTGVGPFDVVYTDGSSNFSIDNISDGHVLNLSPGASTTYSLVEVMDNRAVTCSASDLGSDVTIAVIAEPDADILQSSTGGCAPFLATFQNRFNATGTQTWYYREQGSTGRIGELNGSSATYVFDNTTDADLVYEVVLEVQTGSGCIAADTALVTVAPTIVPAFATSANTMDCTPLTVDFSNQSIAGTDGTISLWEWGDGNLPDTTTLDGTISHTFENSSFVATRNFNVTLTVLDTITGCEASTSRVISVYPGVRADIEADVDEACGPLNVNFTNFTQGATDHLWYYQIEGTTDVLGTTDSYFANFDFPNQTTSTIRYEVIYIGSTTNGCADTASTIITVFPELDADFDATPQRQVLPESTVTVTNNTPRKNAWTHFWDFGDGTTSTEVDPDPHTYGNFGTYRISLTISNGDCEETIQRVVEVLPVEPVIDFSFTPAEGCAPLNVAFTNLSEFANVDTYRWNFGDGSGSQVVNPTHTYSEPGTYTVSLSGSNDLGIVITRFAEVNIQAFQRAAAAFNVRPGLVFLNGDGNGNQVSDRVAYANFSINASSYLWDFGDSTTSEDFEPTHQYTAEGIYDVTLIAYNENGCHDTSMVELAVTVQAGGDVGIPNVFTPSEAGPSGGFVSGGGTGAGNEGNDIFLPRYIGVVDFQMEIYSRWGELIFYSDDQNVGWDGYIDGRLAPQGVYLYKLTLEFVDGQRTTRLGDVTILR